MTRKEIGNEVEVAPLPDGRKIFYVDVNNLPMDKAFDYVSQVIEKIKSKKD